MNNKKFGLLLSVINVISVITLEKYWKNGFKITYKKKQQPIADAQIIPMSPPVYPDAEKKTSPFSVVA
jgi:hypothetical protein